MKQPVQITFHGMAATEALEGMVRDRVERLERFSASIMACRVVIDLLQKHHQQGRPYGVRIDLTIPGHELVVDRVEHEDVYIAVRDAFDDMTRRLEDVVRLQRGKVKHHAPELHGEVARLDIAGGFGFLRTADGQEYYFGRDNLASGQFDQLEVGTAVQFIGEPAGEGLQAKRVSLGKHGVP